MDMKEVYFVGDDEVDVNVYEVFERVVETEGEFLWPKQRRADGKTFGFDARELARKKAKYLDITQFYAQYYNNPNALENQLIGSDRFQYYSRENVETISGQWYVGDKPINVYAAMDFAYTVNNTSDYTVIILVGIDEDSNYYVLDIDRFKTNRISVMYEHVEKLYRKWRFRKIRCEVVAAQKLIITQFKEHMRGQSIVFTIDEYYPPRTMNKKERIASVLEPRYANNMVWHYKGGNCQILEEELLMENPEHDDVKDSLAACVEICKPPMKAFSTWNRGSNVVYHSKFGGVAS
jgi:phage terminase large subunit-like protein